MKFELFNLMPWPHLPDDFRERHRSVWVDIPPSLYDPARGHHRYHEYLDQLQYADELGFDGIGVNEHHQTAYGLMPSPNLMAAILARTTTRAKIVVLGDSVALYNPPTRVAEELAMIDVLSRGRLVAGFPVGVPMDSTYCYGQVPVTLRDKHREAVDLILRAWEAEEPFPFNGKHTQLRYVNVWPRPFQRPRPPIWIPGAGSVETWRWCLENDFLYAYLTYWGWESAVRVMDGFWETAALLDVDRDPHRAAIFQLVAIADSDAEAERLYGDHARYFYDRCLHVHPGFGFPPGYTGVESMRRGLAKQMREIGEASSGDVTWRDIVGRGYILAGAPETVAGQLAQAAERLNFGHLLVGLHFGSMPHELARENMRRFAAEVMPALRGRGGAEDDRWWPAEPEPVAA